MQQGFYLCSAGGDTEGKESKCYDKLRGFKQEGEFYWNLHQNYLSPSLVIILILSCS